MSKTENSNKSQTPAIKNQMPHDSVQIKLAMEIPSKPQKPNPTNQPPSDKK